MLASGNPPVHLFRYADFRYIPKTYGDQPVNLNASMMCGAKVLNEKSVSVRTRRMSSNATHNELLAGEEREYRSVVVALVCPIDRR
jgi:hypothetical protein